MTTLSLSNNLDPLMLLMLLSMLTEGCIQASNGLQPWMQREWIFMMARGSNSSLQC